MRENNIFWKDYEAQLEADGITPEEELQDVLSMLKDKGHEDIEDCVHIIDEILKTGKAKRGRKTYTKKDLAQFVCIPVLTLENIQRGYPIIKKPNGDGSYSVRRDLPPEVKVRCKMLHWIYIELETVMHRTMD